MESIRAVLEVCRFVSPIEVMQSVEKVSHLFATAASSEELWRNFVADDLPNYRFSERGISAKSIYVRECVKKIVYLTTSSVVILYLPLNRPVVRTLSTSLRFDCSSVYTLLPTDCIFLCGGLQNLSYLIDSQSGSIQPRPPLLVIRQYPGLFSHKAALYAFGGIRDSCGLRRAERFIYAKEEWKDIAKMNFAHSQFTPCGVGELVYLFGREGQELFRVKSETYQPLNIPFPLGSSGVITIATQSAMLIISDKMVSMYHLAKGRQPTSKSAKKREIIPQSQNFAVYGRDAYFLLDSTVFRVSYDTLAFVRYASMQ